MDTGYFAAIAASAYRRTRDDHLVTALRLPPLYRRQWRLVSASDQTRFERRTKFAHLVPMGIIVVAAASSGDISWRGFIALLASLILVVIPAMQAWATLGLPRLDLQTADLVPIDRRVHELESARVLGRPMVVGFIFLSGLLLLPQAYVAVTTGEWWAWLGVVAFATCGGYFVSLLLRLRGKRGEPRAT